jgi:hypothetical protein
MDHITDPAANQIRDKRLSRDERTVRLSIRRLVYESPTSWIIQFYDWSDFKCHFYNSCLFYLTNINNHSQMTLISRLSKENYSNKKHSH